MNKTRIKLPGGRWFSPETSECFEETIYWDGKNHISRATGSQWEHEQLYRTRTGTWVLHEWSQWHGSGERYRIVEAERARAWLLLHLEDEAVEKYFPGAIAETEI